MAQTLGKSVCVAVAALAGAFLLAGGAGAQSQPAKVKFVLDWTWQATHAMWTLAEDNGHFKAAGLDVTIDRGFGSGDTVAKVASRTYDIGYADGNVLFKFNHANPNDQLVTVLIIFDASPASVVFLNKTGIKTPKDLEGKTLSATKGEGTNLLFPVFAKANNLDMSKIKWQHVEPALRDTLVLNGQADGTLGWATTAAVNMIGTGVARDKVGYLRFHDFGVQPYSSGLVVRKDFAEKNPEVVRAFVKATIRGIQDFIADPKSGIASLKKRDPLLKDDIELLRFDLIRDLGLVTPHVQANGFSTVDRTRFERGAAQAAEAYELPFKPKMEDTYTDKYLPPKAERMVKR